MGANLETSLLALNYLLDRLPLMNTPAEAPVGTPLGSPVETPVGLSVETPVKDPVRTSAKTPLEIPVKAPVGNPVGIPVHLAVQNPVLEMKFLHLLPEALTSGIGIHLPY